MLEHVQHDEVELEKELQRACHCGTTNCAAVLQVPQAATAACTAGSCAETLYLK
jgi:hypothetical protein